MARRCRQERAIRMVGKGKNITKADRRRFLDLQDVGCIACLMDGRPGVPADIHHGVDGGYRKGHQHTAPLCPWHHRGHWVPGVSLVDMKRRYGPSLVHNGREFRARYGTDAQLVERADQELAKVREGIVGGG